MRPRDRASAFAPLVLAIALSIGCEPTPGTPLPPDTGVDPLDGWTPPADAPRDTTPVDVGIYDAPAVPDGNCELFIDDAAPLAIECEPDTTCDVTGQWPLCARNQEAGVRCGEIWCVGPACGGHLLDHCVGFTDPGLGN